nr:cobyric acid synthase [Lachnospiraceae bacterium]
VDAPVLLVGDIDRGGVFAQLYGTIALLEQEERDRIRGLVINKFRGDKTILDPGIAMLEERCHIPVTGVVPYMDLMVDDEDSLSPRFFRRKRGLVNVMVIRLPHIANFTDFSSLEQVEGLEILYTTDPRELSEADLVILPGSKNTMADMEWLRTYGMDRAIYAFADTGKPLMGICGGYQMLGEVIRDPAGVESLGETRGLGLLPVETVLAEVKQRRQSRGIFTVKEGPLKSLDLVEYEGYEIHMGQTLPLVEDLTEFTSRGSGYYRENIYGTYIHGLFDQARILRLLSLSLAEEKGITLPDKEVVDQGRLKEQEYDKLAQTLREHMDLEQIYKMMGINRYEDREDQTVGD